MGAGPHKSEWTNSKCFIDLDSKGTKGNLWLLAIWHEEQNSEADCNAFGTLQRIKTILCGKLGDWDDYTKNCSCWRRQEEPRLELM